MEKIVVCAFLMGLIPFIMGFSIVKDLEGKRCWIAIIASILFLIVFSGDGFKIISESPLFSLPTIFISLLLGTFISIQDRENQRKKLENK